MGQLRRDSLLSRLFTRLTSCAADWLGPDTPEEVLPDNIRSGVCHYPYILIQASDNYGVAINQVSYPHKSDFVDSKGQADREQILVYPGEKRTA